MGVQDSSAAGELTISVVIPVRDRIKSLKRAVASALAQTRLPDEIVIIDDESVEPITLAALEQDNPRIRILRLPKNQGASGARMAGIEAARCDLIAFLDSDDVFLPEKLEAQLPLIGSGQDLIAVACGWEARDEATGHLSRRIPIPSADPIDFASGCWFSPGSTVLIPKQAFVQCGPFDPALRRLEDLDWFLRFALAGGQLRVASIIGSRIAIGRRAKAHDVFVSRHIIQNKISASQDPRTLSCLRNLCAWLHVEQAVALRNDGRLICMGWELFRSFILKPRLRVSLRKWWS